MHPRVGCRAEPPGILARVLDRPRIVPLAWAGVCAALFVAARLPGAPGPGAADGIDDFGRTPSTGRGDGRAATRVLRGIEDAFGTIGMTVGRS